MFSTFSDYAMCICDAHPLSWNSRALSSDFDAHRERNEGIGLFPDELDPAFPYSAYSEFFVA